MARRHRKSRDLMLRGLGATGDTAQAAMAAVPSVVGGGVALASLAIMRSVDPTKTKTNLFVYRHAPWLALGAGTLGAIAVGVATKDVKNGVIAGSTAGLVAAAAFTLDKMLTGTDNAPKAAVLAMNAEELEQLVRRMETSPNNTGTAGLGAYYSTRSLGAAAAQDALHGISMTPVSGGLGYRPYVGGQTVTLNGVVNSAAFGTPAFRV